MGVGGHRQSLGPYPQERDSVPIVQALLPLTLQIDMLCSGYLRGIKAQNKWVINNCTLPAPVSFQNPTSLMIVQDAA
jgi:hypothetical protein